MAYIPLEDHLPGITGLLEYRRDTAEPIRELTQVLLRGPSTLTEGEISFIFLFARANEKGECRVGKGESHPQTSHRTVREPLDSYGSSQSSHY